MGGRGRVPWWHLHRRAYDWTIAWAYRPSAAVALFLLSFAESSFFPLPPDALLIPLVLGNREKWLRYAFLCSLASVIGGIAGYMIGFGAWQAVGGYFFDWIPGFTRERFDQVNAAYEDWSFWVVFTAGFTPLPFKVITITAGVFKINFAIFVLAAAVSRSARFFLVSGLCRKFGPKVTPLIEKYFGWISLAFVALLVGGFAILKYVL